MRKMLLLVFFILFTGNALAYDDRALAPGYMEMQGIAKSTALTTQEKMQKLEKYLDDEKTLVLAAYFIAKVDKTEGAKMLWQRLKDDKTPRDSRLYCGRLLLQLFEYQEAIPVFKEFLIHEITTNIDDFLKPQEEHHISAVGEYAFIAGNFEGYKGEELFELFKDKRVVPYLIKALDAPDWVLPKDQGDLIRGIPGASTGRNVAREQIPMALARLDAQDAIPALLDKFKNHPDKHYNAAYALGYLLGGDQKASFEKIIRGSRYKQYQFAFARGLIKKGDFSGLDYLHIDIQPQEKYWLSITYEIGQKMNVIQGIKDKRVSAFCRELIENQKFRLLVEGDVDKIEILPDEFRMIVFNKDKSAYFQERLMVWTRNAYKDLLTIISLNRLDVFVPVLKEIGKQSKDQEIQKMTKEFLATMKTIQTVR